MSGGSKYALKWYISTWLRIFGDLVQEDLWYLERYPGNCIVLRVAASGHLCLVYSADFSMIYLRINLKNSL